MTEIACRPGHRRRSPRRRPPISPRATIATATFVRCERSIPLLSLPGTPRAAVSARRLLGQAGRQARAVMYGCRQPVVVVLLLIAFFAAISGKPLDGVLMLAVGAALARDAGLHRGRRPAGDPAAATPPPASPAAAQPAQPAAATPSAAGPAAAQPAAPSGAPAPGYPPEPGSPLLAGAGEARLGDRSGGTLARPQAAGPARAALRRWLLAGSALAGGALYALVTGSFTRYSWPATIAVAAVGALAVGRAWRGPVVLRPDPGPLPRRGVALWAGVVVAAGLWELSALLQQPALTRSSYDHPTISTLTDPLLAGAPGRALVLAAWLALGWALIRR